MMIYKGKPMTSIVWTVTKHGSLYAYYCVEVIQVVVVVAVAVVAVLASSSSRLEWFMPISY